MRKEAKPQLRVVMSLHVPKPQHTKIARAARKAKVSLAEFFRESAERRAEEVLSVESAALPAA